MERKDKMQPCGVVCDECAYRSNGCAGCDAISGKPFWLQYTGGEVCEIYRCCRQEKRYTHCGACAELPCKQYDLKDPTRTEEQNETDLALQIKRLKTNSVL